MPGIIPTPDRALMNNYHRREFLGFASSAPPNILPDWLYRFIFPLVKNREGIPIRGSLCPREG